MAKKPFFRCSHSGLLFPGDYVKNWGRTYGIGLGPEPVSEVLDSNYYAPIPTIQQMRGPDDAHHPVGNCRAQVDLVLLDENEIADHEFAILEKDDKDMTRRMAIVRGKQEKNPLSKRRMYLNTINQE